MNKKTLITALLSLALLAGCSGAARLPADKLARARTVGAISLLGDEMNVVQVGTTTFGNSNKKQRVAPGIDRLAVERIKTDLGKTLLSFVDVDYKYSDFVPIYRAASRLPYADYDLRYAQPALAAVKDKYSIELLILIARARREADANNNYLTGYGIFSRAFFGMETSTRAGLAADIAVVDMSDFKILSVASITRWSDLDRTMWKDISDYTRDELKTVASFYRSALESEIDRALDQFGLTTAAAKP